MKSGLLRIAFVVVLSGCVGSKRANSTAPQFSGAPSAVDLNRHNPTNNSPAATNTSRSAESERVIQVGDFLLITFVEPPRWTKSSWGSPFLVQDSGLPAFDQQVKKNGIIRLLFNWEFNVAGKKVSELEWEIRRCYVPEKFGDLTVTVRISSQTNFVYVEGGFGNPGRCSWTAGMRLGDAIKVARGFSESAIHGIMISHRDGTMEEYRLHGGWALTNNPTLRPGDKIRNVHDLRPGDKIRNVHDLL